MFKNIVKITLINYLWKKYKTLIVSTLVLLLSFFLIGKVHDDYVSYSHLNNATEHLGLSFVLKWLAFIICSFASYLINTRLKRFEGKSDLDAETKKTKNSIPRTFANTSNASSSDDEDPFKTIREKEKLRSKADVIIEQNKTSK